MFHCTVEKLVRRRGRQEWTGEDRQERDADVRIHLYILIKIGTGTDSEASGTCSSTDI